MTETDQIKLDRTKYGELHAKLPNKPSAISSILENQAVWTQDICEHVSDRLLDLNRAKREVRRAEHKVKEAEGQAFIDSKKLTREDGKNYTDKDSEAYAKCAPSVIAARDSLYSAMDAEAEAQSRYERWNDLKWNFKDKGENAKLLWEQIKTGYLSVRSDWKNQITDEPSQSSARMQDKIKARQEAKETEKQEE